MGGRRTVCNAHTPATRAHGIFTTRLLPPPPVPGPLGPRFLCLTQICNHVNRAQTHPYMSPPHASPLLLSFLSWGPRQSQGLLSHRAVHLKAICDILHFKLNRFLSAAGCRPSWPIQLSLFPPLSPAAWPASPVPHPASFYLIPVTHSWRFPMCLVIRYIADDFPRA